MKLITLFLCASTLFLSACSPSTQMVQHGNEWLQVTQTYGLFGINVLERTKCAQGELVNGFCPPDKYPSSMHATAEGPGKDIAKAMIYGGALVGGLAILRPNDVRMTQSATGGSSGIGPNHISTFNQGAAGFLK